MINTELLLYIIFAGLTELFILIFMKYNSGEYGTQWKVLLGAVLWPLLLLYIINMKIRMIYEESTKIKIICPKCKHLNKLEKNKSNLYYCKMCTKKIKEKSL